MKRDVEDGPLSPISKFEPVETPKAADFLNKLEHSFGAKEIGLWAGIILMVNNITGPGVPGLPNMFVEAGWLPPLLVLVVIYAMTTVSASMYAEAMSNIPGNEGFKDRIEYSTIVQYYFGRRWYIASQIGLNGALQSLNIISVIQSAQVMDNAISAIFSKSCGMNLTPFNNYVLNSDGGLTNVTLSGSNNFFSCIDTTDIGNGNAWGCHIVCSLGFIITAAMAIPCGRWNLDDNMIIQKVAFALTVVCWLIWFIAILFNGENLSKLTGTLPAYNTDANTGSLAGVLGTILFNFGFVTTVPSWINEKHPSVSVNKSLWWATTACVIIYAAIGIPGAIAFADVLQGTVTNTCAAQVQDPSYNCANDLMQLLSQTTPVTAPWRSSSAATFLLKTSVYLFPIVAVVSSIPVFSIVIKYNLIENGFSKHFGFMWGVIFPWAVAFPLLYMPNVLAQIVNFTSLVFVSFTDFIVPFALYVVLQRRQTNSTRRSSAQMDGLAEGAENLLDSPVVLNDPDDHHALPESCGRDSPEFKTRLAQLLGVVLAGMSLTGIVLTIQQGSYDLDSTQCSLVGN